MNHSRSTPYILTLIGNQLEKQIKFSPDQLLFDVIAKGNAPYSSIAFELENENINGWVDVYPASNISHLHRIDVENEITPWSIYTVSHGDKQGYGTYQFQNHGSTQFLNIHFNNSPIYYHLHDHNHRSSENQQVITMSGQMLFQIPRHWAALQPNRFPQLPIQGQFIFDGKPYTVTETNTAARQEKIGHSISYFLTLEHENEVIQFSIEQDSAFAKPVIQLITNNHGYELHPSFFHKIFRNDGKNIYISAQNLALNSRKGQGQKYLQANLIIPQNYANLTINGQKVNLAPANSELLAEARNEQKIYLLYFYDQNELATLSIIEEEAGHFSLEYGNIHDGQYECGDSEIPCEGLTVHTDKQRFYLNQVRFGQHILHGEIFIAGIL